VVDTALQSVLIEVPRALLIWSFLIALSLVAIVGLLILTRRPWASWRPTATVSGADNDSTETADPTELKRCAEELGIAADRAATTELRRRQEWRSASARTEAAWNAYADAESRARRVELAMVIPVRKNRRPRYDRVERERYLHRAVTAAFWRKELSVLQLSDALAGSNGWNPRLHPIEQEATILRVVRDGFLTSYRAAAAHERAAWQFVETAAAAAQSLRAEAIAAAVRAHQAAGAAPRVQPRSVTGFLRRPKPVIGWATPQAG
jgi:hypothetical protein